MLLSREVPLITMVANKVGYTAPSVQRQCDVIQLALNMAEIDSDALSYIETHGTATPFGDMVEIEALTQAFCLQQKTVLQDRIDKVQYRSS